MGRLGITVLLIALALPTGNAWSQTIRYPRVYGATGRPYGPTQAHYQYQKQYGRPWHGYGGITASVGSGAGYYSANGYPAVQLPYGYLAYQTYGACNFGYGGSFYGGFTPGLGFSGFASYTAPVPPVIYGYPPVVGGYNPFDNSVLQNSLLENDLRRNQPLNLQPFPGANNFLVPASPESQLKSVRAEAQGDMWFQQQEYHKAFDRYKAAVAEAPGRGAAHLRLAVCYAALGHLDLAARQLERGVASDPKLATKATSLKDLYGQGNGIAQSAMVHRATLWAKEDVRDPDRLFLLGSLLYLQGDPRAGLLLETGMMLDGGGEHFRSFLTAAKTSPPQASAQANAGNTSAPPRPQVIDQTPHPESQPVPTINPALPPLPNPPASGAENSPVNPSPSGPVLPLPNR